MSWFDGMIPEVCRACFYWEDGFWKMREDAFCDDSCNFFLALFPVITEDGKLDHEKLDILAQAKKDPVWYMGK